MQSVDVCCRHEDLQESNSQTQTRWWAEIVRRRKRKNQVSRLSLVNINAEGELPQEWGFGYYILMPWEFKVTWLKQEGNCSKTSDVQLYILSKGDESLRLMAPETKVRPDYASYKYKS